MSRLIWLGWLKFNRIVAPKFLNPTNSLLKHFSPVQINFNSLSGIYSANGQKCCHQGSFGGLLWLVEGKKTSVLYLIIESYLSCEPVIELLLSSLDCLITFLSLKASATRLGSEYLFVSANSSRLARFVACLFNFQQRYKYTKITEERAPLRTYGDPHFSSTYATFICVAFPLGRSSAPILLAGPLNLSTQSNSLCDDSSVPGESTWFPAECWFTICSLIFFL